MCTWEKQGEPSFMALHAIVLKEYRRLPGNRQQSSETFAYSSWYWNLCNNGKDIQPYCFVIVSKFSFEKYYLHVCITFQFGADDDGKIICCRTCICVLNVVQKSGKNVLQYKIAVL